MTCKDCLHYEVCHNNFKNIDLSEEMTDEHCCVYFKEKSRCIELPCKVGDTVYDVVLCDDDIYRIFEMKITGMSIFGELYVSKIKPPFIWNLYLTDKYSYAYRIFSDIGKTLFLTKEESEQKLKELMKNDS